MQPIVGTIADSSRSKWGRRRPFMVGGAIIVGIFLLVLGWTTEIVGMFVSEPHAVSDTPMTFIRNLLRSQHLTRRAQKRNCTIALAVLAIYVVDFAINAGLRPDQIVNRLYADNIKCNRHAEA